MTFGPRADSALSTLTGLVESGSDRTQTAHAVVTLARDGFGCDYAGLTAGPVRGPLQTLAATDPVVETLDQLQRELGEGPAFDDTGEPSTVTYANLATDQQWPGWAAAATRAGVQSLLTTRTRSSAGRPHVLSLYCSDRRLFTTDQIDFAGTFVRVAVAAMSTAERLDTLAIAVETRTVIGQAQGILIERFGLSRDEAFAVLRRHSQDANIKLHNVARQLIETGRLPETWTRP